MTNSKDNGGALGSNLIQAKAPQPYSADLPTTTDTTTTTTTNGNKRDRSHKKVSIIGCGQVGMATAFAILNQTLAGAIALVDQDKSKLEGEAMDLFHGSAFHQQVRIEADTDYKVTDHSDLVIITAGVAQKVGESRLALIERNVFIMKQIIPPVLSHSPDSTICIVSNPCDIMTAVAAKIAGPSVPPGRIFGSGTCLDSSRLSSLLGQEFFGGIDARSVTGYVVGEHGDSSVAVWSSVRIGGVAILQNQNEEPSLELQELHRQVIHAAGDVIARKRYTNWAVGLTAAYIAKAVLADTKQIMPLSTCVRGFHDIQNDVFLSMPCIVASQGVSGIMDLPMTTHEIKGFQKSADTVWNIQKDIWDKI